MSNTESELTELFKELEQTETPRIYVACLSSYLIQEYYTKQQQQRVSFFTSYKDR
jgi:hypothetical protein